jgi:peptide/nickel transport system permease protein
MDILKYLGRRLVLAALMLLGVSLMVFVISHLVPADPVASMLSDRNLNNVEMVQAYREKWGLDQPLYRQYFTYLNNLLHGDMGTSLHTGRKVLDDLKLYFPATIELSIMGMLFAVIFGMLFGIISGIKRNSAIDVVLRGVSVFGVSIPVFWLALLMLFLFYLKWGVFPGPGRLSPYATPPPTVTGLYTIDALIAGNWVLFWDAFKHLLLPGMCQGLFTMGLISRTSRSSLLEVLSMDYIRTARSKGLVEKNVIIQHALGNAMIPVLTVIGLGLGNLLGGMVLVESVFAWPGIGLYAYHSAQVTDFPAIVGVSILTAVIFVVLNIIIDICYGLLDPRVRYK